jgi:hypothetical protein
LTEGFSCIIRAWSTWLGRSNLLLRYLYWRNNKALNRVFSLTVIWLILTWSRRFTYWAFTSLAKFESLDIVTKVLSSIIASRTSRLGRSHLLLSDLYWRNGKTLDSILGLSIVYFILSWTSWRCDLNLSFLTYCKWLYFFSVKSAWRLVNWSSCLSIRLTGWRFWLKWWNNCTSSSFIFDLD